jgi:hypothetical protein
MRIMRTGRDDAKRQGRRAQGGTSIETRSAT